MQREDSRRHALSFAFVSNLFFRSFRVFRGSMHFFSSLRFLCAFASLRETSAPASGGERILDFSGFAEGAKRAQTAGKFDVGRCGFLE